MEEARCRRGQAEEGAERDCIGHLGQQGPEDQAAQEPLPAGDQGGGEEAGEREEGPVEMTSAPGEFYIAVIVSY